MARTKQTARKSVGGASRPPSRRNQFPQQGPQMMRKALATKRASALAAPGRKNLFTKGTKSGPASSRAKGPQVHKRRRRNG